MSNRTIMLVVVIFVMIVAGMFLFTYLSKQNTTTQLPEPQLSATPSTNPYGITRIDAKHFFINGVHTIVGELALPTVCDLLTANSRVTESYPEQVTFDFSITNTTNECTQKVTTQRFKVDATASSTATLQATFMGVPVELNLIEAEPGETPETFELYNKG